ncbi:MAG: peptidylprolyl isomerase [Pirellulales bacterium]|nr:peptidylprolyl isomerase [Pirellulales bacterium]
MTQRQNPGKSSHTTWQRRWLLVGGPLAVIGVSMAAKVMWTNPQAGAAGVPGQPARPAAVGGVNPAAGTARQPGAPAAVQPKALPQPGAANPQAQIVANINGEEISREELASACVQRFGKPVIESMINKQLIARYCAQQKIQVTDQDVAVEIDRLARKFRMTSEDYLKMLKQERGIQAEQYASEIVWPTLALRRLAAQKITPTEAEIDQAIEAQYGEAIKTRIIICNDQATAQQVWQQARQNPDDFGALARKHSQDPSASVGGLIPPIRHHLGEPVLEEAAFSLNESDRVVSELLTLDLPTPEGTTPVRQFAILKYEGRLKPVPIQREQVAAQIRDGIVDKKLREEAARIFEALEQQAQADRAIVNVANDPRLKQQFPGVAAQVYQQNITLAQVSEECVKRHGIEVLETMISKRMLQHALRSNQMQVTQDDLDAEVARAALMMGKKNAQGGPDVQAWLAAVTEENGVSVKTYVDDSVWPSVALMKLAGQVEITPEDLQKGYEANYGPRVKCRAIVMSNLRKAQEVWEEARQNPTKEHFAKLAEMHSMDPSSKALQGQIPPIQRHGGQQVLEEEAFKLKPNELSSIINMSNNYVILFCEGYTQPSQVPFAEVQQDIQDDLYEKKLRIQMAQTYSELKENSRVDNYLAGTMHYPTKKAAYQQAAGAAVDEIPANTPTAAGAQPGPRR